MTLNLSPTGAIERVQGAPCRRGVEIEVFGPATKRKKVRT